ncbi:MAG: hypothetical protein JWO13_3759 [Acidobacteriales bacterium]|nr:hypothetical protein [Terriglobales bacterium]
MTTPWHEELRHLAEVESPDSSAVTFYFQPETPQNASHREEAILVKDMVRDAIRKEERNGNRKTLRADLERIQEIGEMLHGNHSRAKAIFACADKKIWREFDLPALDGGTRIHVNSRFWLKPMAVAVLEVKHCLIALVDSEKARILDYYMGELTERERFEDDISRKVRSDGFGGLEAGHVERHVENDVMRHVKRVADRLFEIQSEKKIDCLMIGCRQEFWPDIEPHLHPYLKKSLVGRFNVDPGLATPQEIQEMASTLLAEIQLNEQQARVREVIGEAQRNGRGSLGLRHVITSLERGEMQTLLLGQNFSARVVQCTHCGHMDTRIVEKCAVCEHDTRHVDDVADALIGIALRMGVQVLHVDDEEFANAGNIGALLRFRADQNTAEKLAS